MIHINHRNTWGIVFVFLLVVALSSCFHIKNTPITRHLTRHSLNSNSIIVNQQIPLSTGATKASSRLFHRYRNCNSALRMEIMDLGDDSSEDVVEAETHGYEGDFKVGDIVKVKIHTKLYHVIKYRKDGFDPYGFIGKVSELALYGRKKKTLCSAITPVKVTFEPDGGRGSYPEDMFDKKFVVHFSGDELDLVERP